MPSNKKFLFNKNLYVLKIFTIVNNFMFFFNFFYFFFKYIENLNYFKKIYLNFDYFKLLTIKNSKKEFLYYYTQFKKQNSLLKKKYMFLNTLNPLYFKKNSKKKLFEIKNNNNVSLIKENKEILLKNSGNKKFNSFNTLNGKKKLKKTILLNRYYLNYLNHFNIKRSKKLNKFISLTSKQKISNILLSYQYGLINVISSTNLFKSYNDICKLLNSKNIYVNRLPSLKWNYILNTGDLVEFNINYRLYNYIVFLKQLSNKISLKLKNKLWFKIKNNHNNGKFNLNSSYLLKTTNIQNSYKSIQEFIEFDYYTLTFFVIYKNLKLSNLNINIKKLLVVYLFKLYNWK